MKEANLNQLHNALLDVLETLEKAKCWWQKEGGIFQRLKTPSVKWHAKAQGKLLRDGNGLSYDREGDFTGAFIRSHIMYI